MRPPMKVLKPTRHSSAPMGSPVVRHVLRPLFACRGRAGKRVGSGRTSWAARLPRPHLLQSEDDIIFVTHSASSARVEKLALKWIAGGESRELSARQEAAAAQPIAPTAECACGAVVGSARGSLRERENGPPAGGDEDRPPSKPSCRPRSNTSIHNAESRLQRAVPAAHAAQPSSCGGCGIRRPALAWVAAAAAGGKAGAALAISALAALSGSNIL